MISIHAASFSKPQVVLSAPIPAFRGFHANSLFGIQAVRKRYYSATNSRGRNPASSPSIAPAVAPTPRGFLTTSQLSNTQVYTDWRNTYVKDAGSGSGAPAGSKYVRMDLSPAGGQYPRNITTSEATAYGMLASVLMDKEADFKAFLQFYEHWQRTKDHMSWQVAEDSHEGYMRADGYNSDSATDGDLDAAYALFLASERGWTGASYKGKGQKICAALKTHCINQGTKLPMLGNWAGTGGTRSEITNLNQPNEARSAPHNAYFITRTGDWMLGHFRKFSQHDDPSRTAFWSDVYDKVKDAYVNHFSSPAGSEGLIADFHVFDTSIGQHRPVVGYILEKEFGDGYFGFNACRVPWRLAAYLKDVGQTQATQEGMYSVMQAQQRFFENILTNGNQGTSPSDWFHKKILAGYKLDGSIGGNFFDENAWMGPALALLKVMNSREAQQLERDVTEKYNSTKNYYSDTLLLLSLLQSM